MRRVIQTSPGLAAYNSRTGYVVCPHCEHPQEPVGNVQPDTYQCDYCYENFKVTEDFLEEAKTESARDIAGEREERFDSIEDRLEEVERQLGIRRR